MSIYFDHNATTPLLPEVLESMMPFFREHAANASSPHGPGRRARAAIEDARKQIALLIACTPDEIVFTGSGTEADNLAIRGVASARASAGRHIVISAIEHHAVLSCAEALVRDGYTLSKARVDGSGRVDPTSVIAEVNPHTILVSVMHANNETGAIQPIRDIGLLAHGKSVLFHTDAVQTAGKLPIDVSSLGVDLLSISAHKMHGPKGAAALFVKKGSVALRPLMYGGGQEGGLRPGTYDVPAIVGFGTAATIARRSLIENAGYVEALRDHLEEGIRRIAPAARILVDRALRLPGTLLVCFPGEDNHALVAHLDEAGIAVSSGAACTSGSSEISHVLAAMGIAEGTARGALRFSLGITNTEAEVDEALRTLKTLLGRKRPGPRGARR